MCECGEWCVYVRVSGVCLCVCAWCGECECVVNVQCG